LARPEIPVLSAVRLSAVADPSTHSLVGIESFRQSARLAGLTGGLLLVMSAVVVGAGTAATHLDGYWLAWAVIPALLAAFGGPWLGRHAAVYADTGTRRLLLVTLMLANSSAWTYAAVVSVSAINPVLPLLVLAWLALSVALLPSLSWPIGLALQLVVQLGLTVGFSVALTEGWEDGLLPLGLWLSLAFLASMAALYARRSHVMEADGRYLEFENSELRERLDDTREQLEFAKESRGRVEAELAEILDLAEAANRAKTEFLATMSHEIRTPLNGILPILEMLQDSSLDEEQGRLVRTAQTSSRHLLRIINDILDFAKVESGKLQLESIEIDTRELVGSILELMRESARNRGLKLQARIADNVPEFVRGDPYRLRQVLINLVSNAIKFTEVGGIRIEISRGESRGKQVELLFAVADTGIGMTQETSDRLFQLFTQADASTTRKHGGTGLGLVICKRLVELMGGRIGVRSVLGQGSTFWFLVPLRKSVTEVPTARRDLKGVRVLSVIEDRRLAQRVVEQLRAWGINEELANDHEHALTLLRSMANVGDSWGFELLLIDGNVPWDSLTELLERIREVNAANPPHVVVLLRDEQRGAKLERAFGVHVLTETMRMDPLHRLLLRLFDVEKRLYGRQAPRPTEIYDDLNLDAVPRVTQADTADEGPDDDARVLLVEDNPVNQAVVGKALEKLGVRHTVAENGEQAVERWRGGDFDLIFMDCQMPILDGYEATRRIRELEKATGRSTPIVAMTANAMEGDRERCLLSGMDDYLPKPVSITQLKGCLAKWLPDCADGDQAPPGADHQEAAMVLDEQVLTDLRDLMQEDYLGLLETYLKNAPGLLREARAAADAHDVAAMVIPVHSLKSSSANVGAMAVSALAREGEQLARNGDLSGAIGLLERLDSAFVEADLALREHIASHQAA
jgi:signal transduction histidine kinase/CheY-like chemotaxis protein